MYIKRYLLTVLSIFCVTVSFAQVNLKELRAKPDTSIVDTKKPALSNYTKVDIPIPELNLQVNYWKHWTKFGVNANQASFSENWSGGGVNSVAIGFLGWHKAEYNRNNFQFISELDLRYGKIKNKDQLAKKNNDRIFWDNKLSYKISKSWAIYTSVTFESQFDVGYKYKINSDGVDEIIDTVSSFMAPGYLTESLGLEYKPDNSFSIRLGTGTARQTFVLDDRINEMNYGLEEGKKVKNDLAFQITANLDKNLSKNLNLKSRYNMFADYKDISDPDHRLDITLTAKVTRLVNVSLNGIMLYDSDIHSKIQFSQSLAMGLTYSLPH